MFIAKFVLHWNKLFDMYALAVTAGCTPTSRAHIVPSCILLCILSEVYSRIFICIN